MARKMKDNKDNELLGKAEKLVEVGAKNSPTENIDWDSQQIASKSETHLEDDAGEGEAAIIRMFEYGANPLAFSQHTPTKQELFNYHHKQIEITLWSDGLKIIPEVNPTVTINKDGSKYRIFVGAKAQKGHILSERPKTLTEIAHKL